MKKLLSAFLLLLSLLGHGQMNVVPVVYEDKFNTIDPSVYPVIFLTSRTGFSGNIWKIIPNDRRTPESDSIRKHSSGIRYRRMSFFAAVNDPNLAKIYRPVQASVIPNGSLSAWINNSSISPTGLFWKNERLGVGNADPQYPADITGSMRIKTGTHQNLLVKPYIAGTSGMSLSAANDTSGLVPLEVHSSVTAFLYGKVLINTLTNNGQNFQVSGSSLLNGTVTVGGSIVPASPMGGSLGSSGYPFNNGYLRKIYGNGSNELEISSQSANDIGFYSSSGGTLRMKIKGTSGNVGIGTASVTDRLTVSTTNADEGITVESTHPDAVGPVFEYQHNSASPAAGDFVGVFRFMGRDASLTGREYGSIFSRAMAVTNGSHVGSLALYASGSASTNSYLQLFNDTGYVGIGIGASPSFPPQSKLHIQNTSAATNSVTQVLRIDSQSSGTPAVGIGSAVAFAIETAANNTEVGATIEAVTTDVTAGAENIDLVLKTMTSGATATEKMRVTAEGNMGIGTPTPTSPVDIAGDSIRIRTNFTPTGTGDSRGQVGVFASDDNYIYKKTAAGWKRIGTFATF